ncbi:MAG: hypothetical protein JST53_14495 [Actinobacteria bacterium]|nr:hypothetical protein [Actinomycetota bacterium]
MPEQAPEVAVNLIPLRDPARIEDFKRFSAEVDQPICLAQDVVLGFDAFAVTRRDEGAPSVDIVEVMTVRSWNEWVDVRDNMAAMEEVTSGFEELIDPATVRTLFATPIGRR